MKWLATHEGRRTTRHPELQQDFAVERDLAREMPAIVGEEHRVVTWTPCARGYRPSPQERRKLPSRSKTIIGCTPRLKTYTLSWLSTPIPPTSLKDQPSGSFAQSAFTRYRKSPFPTIIDHSFS
jgi:hypothetical protein